MSEAAQETIARERIKIRVGELLLAARGYKDMADFFYDHYPTPAQLQDFHQAQCYHELIVSICALVQVLRLLCPTGGGGDNNNTGTYAAAANNNNKKKKKQKQKTPNMPTHYADRTFSVLWYDLVDDPGAPSIAKPGELFRALGHSLTTIALVYRKVLDNEPAVTKKDKLLQYFLWIVRGRRDEDNPVLRLEEKEKRQPGGPPVAQQQQQPTKRPARQDEKHIVYMDAFDPAGNSPWCAHCGRPGARTLCPECPLDDPCEDCVKDGQQPCKHVFGTYYCGDVCLDADADRHRRACEEVRALIRAEELFMSVYGLFLRHCNDTDPKDITYDGDGIGTLVTAWHDTIHRRAYRGAPLFKGYPRGIAPAIESVAAMSYTSAGDVFTTAELLFELFFRPVVARVEEVFVQPKNMARTVLLVEGTRRKFSALALHHPLRITLPCGLQFAFDPTSAQYGWSETMAPWDVYMRHRAHQGIRHINIKQPLPVSATEACKQAQHRRDIVWQTPLDQAVVFARLTMLEHMAVNVVDTAAATWSASLDDIVSVVLTTVSNRDFEVFVGAMQRQLQIQICDLVRQASVGHRLFFDEELNPHLTRSPAQCRKLEKVWLSEQEYLALKTPRRAQRTYTQRFRKKCMGPNGLQ